MAIKANKILSLYLLVFFASVGNVSAQKYKAYQGPHYKVSIPETWTYIPNYKDALFLVHRPVTFKGESKIENAVLSKVNDTAVKSIQDVYNSSMMVKKMTDSTTIITDHFESAKSKYYWYASTHTNSKTRETIENMTIVFYTKKHAYILQCTMSPSTYDIYKGIFLKIADSLEFN